MNRGLLVRGLLFLGIVAVAVWLIYPPSKSINLGLDLQGGMHLVLQVHAEDALRAETDQELELFLQQLEKEGVTGVQGERLDSPAAEAEAANDEPPAAAATRFVLRGVPAAQGDKVREIYDRFFTGRWEMARQGGDYVLSMTAQTESDIREKTVDQARITILNRIDAYGVTEPVIQRQGFGNSDRLVLQLPGVDDPERVKSLIKQTAFLEFRLVADNAPGLVDSPQEILRAYGGFLPPNVEILPGDRLDAAGKVVGEGFYALQKTSVISGRDLKNADVDKGENGLPVVRFRLSPEKGQLFGEITGANIDRQLAIVLDGRVISAPVIRARIYDQGIIEGGFTREEATDLSTSLRSGALPAGITTLEERTVGPALGQDSIDQSLFAGFVGAGLVVLLMLVVYLLSGFNAVAALIMNVLMIFGFLALFGSTLTLPGIAGIILTIGMAVDANVLIFERIREELRAGRTVKASIDTGFEKAMSSILDANITTVLAGVFLFQFGTGPIRGFAVTLMTGIACSVFTAVFVSRWIFDLWLSGKGKVEKISI